MGFAAVHILVFLKINSYHNNFCGKKIKKNKNIKCVQMQSHLCIMWIQINPEKGSLMILRDFNKHFHPILMKRDKLFLQ